MLPSSTMHELHDPVSALNTNGLYVCVACQCITRYDVIASTFCSIYIYTSHRYMFYEYK